MITYPAYTARLRSEGWRSADQGCYTHPDGGKVYLYNSTPWRGRMVELWVVLAELDKLPDKTMVTAMTEEATHG